MATVSLNSSAGRWTMTATILASAMAFIDGTALNVVLPSLQQSLGASGTALFWVLNAYLLMLAALVLIGGALGDHLGRKKIFMTGIAIFMAGSVACGFAGNVELLIAFRAVQGIGGALMIPGSLSLISATINEAERGRAIGTWSAITTMVTVGGPVLGGALGDAGLWRYIFFINIPIGIAALFILAFKVSESRSEAASQHIDYPGATTIALGLAALTFGFLRMPAVGWHSPEVSGTLIAGILLLAAFLFIEYRSPHPMMPLQLFADSTFAGTNLLTFFLYAGLRAGMLFLSLNLVQVQGYDQLQSGLTLLPFTILMIAAGRLSGSLADKFGARLLLIVGPLTTGIGLYMLSLVEQTSGPTAYWTTFFPGILVFGLGMSFTVAPLTATVMQAAKDHAGTASGVNNAISSIAAVFANAIFGALAVLLFANILQHGLAASHFAAPQQQAILAQAANLGNAKAPSSFGPNEKALALQLFHQSFIGTYRTVLRICAALALLAAAMTLLFVRHTPRKA